MCAVKWISQIHCIIAALAACVMAQELEKSTSMLDRITWREYLTRNVYGWHLSIPAGVSLPGRLPATKRHYYLALGAPNYSYPNCSPHSLSECRFLEHCARPEYLKSFGTFLGNSCPIGNDYIGVCCPKNVPATVTSKSVLSDISSPHANTVTTPAQCNLKVCGVTCSKPIQHRILGGEVAIPRDWPWVATLLRDGGDRFCGGVLITDQHVLTAAHCVFNFQPSDVKVRLGSRHFQNALVETFKMHERYERKRLRNDIAILKLNKKVQFTADIKPICLSNQRTQVEDRNAYFTGWNFQSPTSLSTDVLLEVQLPIRQQFYCRATYDAFRINITESQLCAGGIAGRDACQGDSGGPLMIQNPKSGQWLLVGLLSFGKGCGEQDRPGVYTRVASFENWIKTNAREL